MTAKFDRFMVHVDIGSDEKLIGLTESERLCHIAGVLAIAAKAPVRGCLIVGDTEAEAKHIAYRAGVSIRVAKSTLLKLSDVGVLFRDEGLGCYRVHNWEVFNPPPKHDKTAAERAKRYRDRRASRLRHARDDRDANGTVTPLSRGEVEGEVQKETTTTSAGLALKVVGVPVGETAHRRTGVA
jgi:hypothetical protein